MLAIVGCGGGGSDGGGDCDPIAATLVSRIVVTPALPTLSDGASVQLVATAFSCDDTQLSVPSFAWSSGDATTVSVSASGLAVGVKVGGPVTVTAVAQGKQGTAHVLVAPRAVASVRVEPATANVAVGRTSTLVAKAFDAEGNELAGRSATWTSSNEALLTVSPAGAITGVSAGGPVTVTATIEGQSGTAQVTVVAAAVASVTVSPPTSTIEAGATVQLSAELKDDQGNVLTGRAITWSTSDALRASVSNSGLVTGLAPGGPVAILATSEGRSGDAQVTVTPAPATKIAFLTQPSNTVAGVSISPAVRVEIQNAFGARVTTSTASVTLSLTTNPGTGTLGGTTTVAAVNGIATFNGLNINRPGTGYRLGAVSAGLTSATSSTFNIIAGAPASLRFVVQPHDVSAGTAIDPAPQVELLDALGNRSTGATTQVTLSLGNNPAGAPLNGDPSVPAVNGVATFSGLSINLAGTGYVLAASATSLTGATSSPFTVTPGAPAALAFDVQPSNGTAGSSIAPPIQVSVRDAFGNVVANPVAQVTLAIGNNPDGGTLNGTLTVGTTGGIATFGGLTLDRAGFGYTLVASAPDLISATSAAFDIVAGAPFQLLFKVQPATTNEGVPIAPAVEVEVRDAQGNRATNLATPYIITIDVRNSGTPCPPASVPGAPPGGTSLSGTTTADASVAGTSPGVGTFGNLIINVNRDRTLTLRATAGSLSVVSCAFLVNG